MPRSRSNTGIAGLALAVAAHRLLDAAERRQQLAPSACITWSPYPSAAAMNAWIRPSLIRCSSSSTAPNSPSSDSISDSHRLRDRRRRASPAAPASPSTSIFSVDRKSSSSSREPFARPRPRELEAVRHLVHRDERPEVRGVERPVALELRDVRHDEQERSGPRSRDRDVVLAHARVARGTRAPCRPARPAAAARAARTSRPWPASPRGPPGRALHGWPRSSPSAIRCAAGSSSSRRLSVFAFTQSARRTGGPRDVGGRLEAGEPRDVQLGDAHDLLERRRSSSASARGRRGPPARSRCRSGGPSPSSRAPTTTTSRAGALGRAARRRTHRGRRIRTGSPCIQGTRPCPARMGVVSDQVFVRIACRSALGGRGLGLGRRRRRRRHLRVHRNRPGPLERGGRDRPALRGVGRARRCAARTRSRASSSTRGRSARWRSSIARATCRVGRGQRRDRVLGAAPGRCLRGLPPRHRALKEDVPIWKKEALVSGDAHWVMGS